MGKFPSVYFALLTHQSYPFSRLQSDMISRVGKAERWNYAIQLDRSAINNRCMYLSARQKFARSLPSHEFTWIHVKKHQQVKIIQFSALASESDSRVCAFPSKDLILRVNFRCHIDIIVVGGFQHQQIGNEN